jgi:hypothetical protein
MAVTSIDEVLDKVSNQHLTRLLIDNKNHHSELGNKLHGLLMQHGSDEKDPNPVAKGMSWIKTNIKINRIYDNFRFIFFSVQYYPSIITHDKKPARSKS